MKPIKYIAITLTILFTSFSCEDDPVTPKIEPGRRDYTWEIDTLKMPFYSSLDRIWGSSENDVWAIGPGGDLSKTLYHYDGTKWQNDNFSRPISPLSIYGFAQNDVWLGGMEGRIWHYDGFQWSESFWYRKSDDSVYHCNFMDIYGAKPDDVYAIGFIDSTDGRKGIMFHYNGKKWSRVSIPKTRTTLMRMKKGERTSENYFVWGILEDDHKPDTLKILLFQDNQFTELYSSTYLLSKVSFIQEINKELIFVIGYSLNRYSNNKFIKFYDIKEEEFGIQIFGRTDKDIFLRMKDGIAHYNGSNIEYLIRFKDDYLVDGIVFEKDIFFLANNFNKHIDLVYHGKLKE